MLLTGKNRLRCNGFSMIEMMVTVVVVAVCLILVFRVFSICAAAVSEARTSIAALNILENQMNLLQEKAIMEDGLDPSSYTENVTVKHKIYELVGEVSEWSDPQETTDTEEDEESVTTDEEIDLRQARISVIWSAAGKARSISVETLIPAKEFRHEF